MELATKPFCTKEIVDLTEEIAGIKRRLLPENEMESKDLENLNTEIQNVAKRLRALNAEIVGGSRGSAPEKTQKWWIRESRRLLSELQNIEILFTMNTKKGTARARLKHRKTEIADETLANSSENMRELEKRILLGEKLNRGRQEELDRIQRDVELIEQLFLQMCHVSTTQQPLLNTAEERVDLSASLALRGKKEISYGVERKKDKIKLLAVILVIFTLFLMLVLF